MPSENNRRRTTAKPNQPETSKKKKDVPQSPFAGCTIIIAAAVMMLFLVGFTIWSLFRVDSEISKFTEKDPVPTAVLEPLQFESEFNDLSRRLDGFRAAVLANQPAELTLSTQDLNLSIAAHHQFEELRETFYILSLSPTEAKVQISYRINGKPIGDTSHRYLNGTFRGKPRLESGQLLIDIDHIDSLKGTVPDEFAAHLSDHQITAPYLKDELLGPIMKKLTSLELSENALIIKAQPDVIPPGQQDLTMEEIEQTKKIALTAFAIVIVVFGLLLFIFLKWRGNR
ncbi:MAG: hypothetical protein ACSHYB_01170 [Roseibacillus sp.]